MSNFPEEPTRPAKIASGFPLDDPQSPIVYLAMLYVEQNRRRQPVLTVMELEAMCHPHAAVEPIKKLWDYNFGRMAQQQPSGRNIAGTVKPTDDGRAMLMNQRHRILQELDERKATHERRAVALRRGSVKKPPDEQSAVEEERRAGNLTTMRKRIERLQADVLASMPKSMEQVRDLEDDAQPAKKGATEWGGTGEATAAERVDQTPDAAPKPLFNLENIQDFIKYATKPMRKADIAEHFGVATKKVDALVTKENGFALGPGGRVKVADAVGAEPVARAG